MEEKEYIVATAIIDGAEKIYYRDTKYLNDGVSLEYVRPANYNEVDIQRLREVIKNNASKIKRLKIFYSNSIYQLRNIEPEVLKELLKLELEVDYSVRTTFPNSMYRYVYYEVGKLTFDGAGVLCNKRDWDRIHF